MATVGQYLDRNRAQLGKQEEPLRSNHVPGVTDQPGFWDDFWCAMNASVCCRDVGIPLWTAAVAGVIERAQRGLDGWSWGTEPRLGALVCFDFPGGGRTDHVASAVEAIRDDGQLITIEGNHNDRCERVVRDPVQYVIGYAYPPFDNDQEEEDLTPELEEKFGQVVNHIDVHMDGVKTELSNLVDAVNHHLDVHLEDMTTDLKAYIDSKLAK